MPADYLKAVGEREQHGDHVLTVPLERLALDARPGGQFGDRQLAAQNVIKGEFYGIGKDVLAERYRFVRSEADYDLYEPRADKPTEWVYCDINICCPLWGGIEWW